MTDCRIIKSTSGQVVVGDPVDVATGANLDVVTDFQLIGPLPLMWHRYYDSSQNIQPYALGWGHAHEYDRCIVYDVDGLRYVTPVGNITGFPPLLTDGDEAARSGMVLRRISEKVYQVRQKGEPSFEFQFSGSSSTGRLVRAFQDDHEIKFIHNSNGFLESIIDSLGRRIQVEHDASGRILSLTLIKPEQKRLLLGYRYDDAGNLIEGADSYGYSFHFQYDSHNRLIRKTDRSGYSFFYEYDSEGRCTHAWGEDGLHEVRLRYLEPEGITVVTKADGGEWTYIYDDNRIVTKIIDPYGGVGQFNFDDEGRLAEEIDPNGNITRILYDSTGAAIGKMTPLNDFIPLPEDPDLPGPKAHWVPDCPLQWEYGVLIRRERVSLPHSYDPVMNEIPYWAQRFVRKQKPKDAEGRTDRQGAVNGRYIVDERTYDELGLLISEKGPEGGMRRWTYDAGGNNIRYRDWDGSAYSYEFASWHQQSRMTDPLGNSVAYQYTPAGKKTVVTDPGGTVHKYDYDFRDRLCRVRRHGVVKEEYLYDQADNLIEKRDGNGDVLLKFEIGPGNLKTVRRLGSGENHYFEYDENGRFLKAATDDISVEFGYDDYGHRVKELRDGRGVEHQFEGHRLVETRVFEKFLTRYTHQPDGLIEIQDPGGQKHQMRIPGNGLVMRNLSNGSSEVSQFDHRGYCLMKAVLRAGSNAAPWSRLWAYSEEGNLLKLEDSEKGASHFTYDAAHRLTSIQLPTKKEQNFVYDAAGNLLEQPGLNGVSLKEGNRLVSANGERFEYNNRNDISRREGLHGSTEYFYDSRDMLVRCETPDMRWQASYDPLGRRISKSYGSKKVEYFWNTDRLAAEIHESGLVRIYIYADAFALSPFMFMEYDSLDDGPGDGRRYFIFSNQIGSPVLVEDEQGRPVWSAKIDPYGTAHVDPASTIEMPLRFPGHYFDSETGLHYNRFRYYSPELGRYIQSDPLGIGGGLNLYGYPGNPVVVVDVRGESKDCPPKKKKPDKEEDKPPEEKNEEIDSKKAPKTKPKPIERSKLEEARQKQRKAEKLQEEASDKDATLRNKTVAVNGGNHISGYTVNGKATPDGFSSKGRDAKKALDQDKALKNNDGTDYKSPANSSLDPRQTEDGKIVGAKKKGDTIEGGAAATHAERQSVTAQNIDETNDTIGVSREQCGNCRAQQQAHAKNEKRPGYPEPVVVADPEYTRVYNSDGSVDVYDKNHEHVYSSKPNESPQATGTNYKGIPW